MSPLSDRGRSRPPLPPSKPSGQALPLGAGLQQSEQLEKQNASGNANGPSENENASELSDRQRFLSSPSSPLTTAQERPLLLFDTQWSRIQRRRIIGTSFQFPTQTGTQESRVFIGTSHRTPRSMGEICNAEVSSEVILPSFSELSSQIPSQSNNVNEKPSENITPAALMQQRPSQPGQSQDTQRGPHTVHDDVQLGVQRNTELQSIARQVVAQRDQIVALNNKLDNLQSLMTSTFQQSQKHFEDSKRLQREIKGYVKTGLAEQVQKKELRTVTHLASNHMAMMIYCEFLKPHGVDLFHLGRNSDDDVLLSSARFALRKEADGRQVKVFLNQSLEVHTKEGATHTVGILQYIARTRSRVAFAVRERAMNAFRLHAPSDSGIRLGDPIRRSMDAAVEYMEDEALLYNEKFNEAWKEASAELLGFCRYKFALERSKLRKKLAEQEIDVENPDLQPCDSYKISAAAFAFLQVKVSSLMETLARGSKGKKMNDSHAFPWGRKMLKLTRQMRENVEAGEELVLHGVNLHRPPPYVALHKISRAIFERPLSTPEETSNENTLLLEVYED